MRFWELHRPVSYTHLDVYKRQLTTLIVNKLRGTFSVVGVKAPGYGDRRKEMLKDIATLTGGQVISEELGLDLKDATIDQLGRAKSVKVEKESTVIVDGMGCLLYTSSERE